MGDLLSLPWQAALEQSWVAYRAGCVPIGAVVASPDGCILARGYNHINDPWPAVTAHTEAVFHSYLAHAELNALIDLDHLDSRDRLDVHVCTLYTTTEPCPLCLGAWYMSGVRTLYYAARDPYAGSVNLLGTTPYLSRKPVRAFGPGQPALEDLVMALGVDYEMRCNRWYDGPVRPMWSAVLPQAVRLGEALNQSGLLRQLAERETTVGAMVDQVMAYKQGLFGQESL